MINTIDSIVRENIIPICYKPQLLSKIKNYTLHALYHSIMLTILAQKKFFCRISWQRSKIFIVLFRFNFGFQFNVVCVISPTGRHKVWPITSLLPANVNDVCFFRILDPLVCFGRFFFCVVCGVWKLYKTLRFHRTIGK